jgi:type IV secretory pathway VirB10-like protein
LLFHTNKLRRPNSVSVARKSALTCPLQDAFMQQSLFDRIELPAPDSRKFSMGPNNAAGAQGENGMSVSVDTHAGREFGNAFLRAVLQAGVNLASRASTVVDIGNGSVLTQSARSTPTFHKYAGEPFTIIVAQDLALDRFMETGP